MEAAGSGLTGAADAVRAALLVHPAVDSVELIGSRAEGRAHELSDWDYAVRTGDFETVRRDLPDLTARFEPLGALWDPYATHECYMLVLRGPTKLDLIFPGEPREWSPPWEPSADTLPALDTHFWDWILWLEQKRRGGRDDVLVNSLHDMWRLLLRPLGARDEPHGVAEAVAAYLEAREAAERRFGVTVPRDLENEVRPVLEQR